MENPIILIYYKYVAIDRPRDIMIQQRAICHELGLKGRILIAKEGINGTVEGSETAVQKYNEYMQAHPLFAGIKLKRSKGTGNAFPKLMVKVRNEIVTGQLGSEDIDPNKISGKYIQADQLHEWYMQGKKFRIIDMRNDYELAVGQFKNTVPSGMENFKDLKKVSDYVSDLKDETIVTVCTSGVRCEKASGYLVAKGFKDVYQLEDGIASYMEKYPNQNFKGSLYVFDGRVVMNFDSVETGHETIGKCLHCGAESENYVNCAFDDCHKHYICCLNCSAKGLPFCKNECEQNYLKLKQNVTSQMVPMEV